MITRFRVEGRHIDKERLMDQLQEAATRIIKVAETEYDVSDVDKLGGDWECTDDRIEGKPGNYRGRMVFIYEEPERANGG